MKLNKLRPRNSPNVPPIFEIKFVIDIFGISTFSVYLRS